VAGGWSQLELPPPEIYIIGVFAGEKEPFQVEIDESQSVHDLKEEIKKENSVTLAAVDAKDLMISNPINPTSRSRSHKQARYLRI
jgi:hypothetical protein